MVNKYHRQSAVRKDPITPRKGVPTGYDSGTPEPTIAPKPRKPQSEAVTYAIDRYKARRRKLKKTQGY